MEHAPAMFDSGAAAHQHVRLHRYQYGNTVPAHMIQVPWHIAYTRDPQRHLGHNCSPSRASAAPKDNVGVTLSCCVQFVACSCGELTVCLLSLHRLQGAKSKYQTDSLLWITGPPHGEAWQVCHQGTVDPAGWAEALSQRSRRPATEVACIVKSTNRLCIDVSCQFASREASPASKLLYSEDT